MLAALAGLFGPGPLSHSSVASPDRALRVEYVRFVRAGGTADLDVTVDAALARDGEITLAIDRDYLDAVDLEAIVPEPSSTVTGPGTVRYAFAVAPDAIEVPVTFSVRPQAMGLVRASVAVPGGPRVRFGHLAYP